MSVIFKGMKMPKSCKECKVACEPYLSLDGLLGKMSMSDSVRSDCPLIEVSETADWIPYGREEEIYCWWGKCSNCGEDIYPYDYCPFCGAKLNTPEDIAHAPTISEAEGA